MRRVQGLMGSWVMCAIQIHQSVGETERKKKTERERDIKRGEGTSGPWRRCQLRARVGLAPGCIVVSPSARFSSLKAWHCQRGKNTILSFCAIHTLSFPVKHAICPHLRVSCRLIECDRAILTLLPITLCLRRVESCLAAPCSDGLSGRGQWLPQGRTPDSHESKEDRGHKRWERVVSESKGEAVMIIWRKEQTLHFRWITPKGFSETDPASQFTYYAC